MKKLTGTIQGYAWGSTTAIPELLGLEPTGEPQAELWLGAHPVAPSSLDGTPLPRWIEADPAGTVGEASVSAFGPRLPYLMKVLAAARPLSLQAHPSRAQAEAGYARESAAGLAPDAANRNYRDDWPKPEVLCALQESEALCGFRDPDETYALFSGLELPSVMALVEPLGDGSQSPSQRLETVFRRLLTLQDPDVVKAVSDAAVGVGGTGTLGAFAQTAKELAEFYPGDPGVLAALLMNRLTMHRYDALFMPAGNLHAYLRGGGVEIMANSDNVMRGGLTPKHIDVDELLSILDFQPGFAGFIHPLEESRGVWRYPTPAPEFALWRVELSGGDVEMPGTGGGRILLITEGSVRLRSPGCELTLLRGQAAFVAAREDATASGHGTVFVGGPGLF